MRPSATSRRFQAVRRRPVGPGALLAAALSAALPACAPAEEDSGPVELPAEDTSAWREDTGTFPFDTADTAAGDETPAHLLTVTHAARWTLGGFSDDPSSVTGELVVTELLDGVAEPPACLATYALVGERADEDCPGCSYTFRVLHTLVSTEGTCRSPERPVDGEDRALGHAEAEGVVWWDWYDTGVWVPLWESVPGELPGEIVLTWETTLGVAVEDEE